MQLDAVRRDTALPVEVVEESYPGDSHEWPCLALRRVQIVEQRALATCQVVKAKVAVMTVVMAKVLIDFLLLTGPAEKCGLDRPPQQSPRGANGEVERPGDHCQGPDSDANRRSIPTLSADNPDRRPKSRAHASVRVAPAFCPC